MSRTIAPIPKGTQRSWTVTMNGRKIETVSSITIAHPRFGRLCYGLTTRGYDGFHFHEAGGGGAVILPYTWLGLVLHVALIKQHRSTQGGSVWNAPRGFRDPGESNHETAIRELWEETGYRAAESAVRELPGKPCNPNSTFFDTSGPDEGVRFYAVHVSSVDVSEGPDGPSLRTSSSCAGAVERAKEGIEGIRFFPVVFAAQVGDMFTVAAIGRLLADPAEPVTAP